MMLTHSAKNKIPILMYHSISHDASVKFKQFTISPVLFSDQMLYLYQNGYNTVNSTECSKMLFQDSTNFPGHFVALTFDDGFADFYTYALPILKKYNFTATLYITTGFIGKTSTWLQREGVAARPMLTWEQIGEIHQSGIECGAHTHHHPQLDTLPISIVRNEIVHSKQLLEQYLEQDVLSFAYPFGYSTAAVRRIVRDAGYTSACVVKHAISTERTDPFALTRLQVRPDTNLHALSALLRGHMPLVPTLYARMRTPIWQMARRAVITRHL
jgi:peptidoglycan/xylan/chitin deacetylase (PgdA/CDA1 family)